MLFLGIFYRKINEKPDKYKRIQVKKITKSATICDKKVYFNEKY